MKIISLHLIIFFACSIEAFQAPSRYREGSSQPLPFGVSIDFRPATEKFKPPSPNLETSIRASLIEAMKTVGYTLPLKLIQKNDIPESGAIAPFTYYIFSQTKFGHPVEGSNIVVTVKWIHFIPEIVGVRGTLFPEADEVDDQKKFFKKTILNQFSKLNSLEEMRVSFRNGVWTFVKRFYDNDTQMISEVFPNGTVQIIDPKVYLEATGRVSGRGVFFDPATTGKSLPLLDLGYIDVIQNNSNKIRTDQLGQYSFPNGSLGQKVSSQLNGSFVTVVDKKGNPLTVSKFITDSSPLFLNFNDGLFDESSTAQVNAYYHTNRVYLWLKGLGVQPSGIEKPITANVNKNQTCNAYYVYATINFFSRGDDCANTSYDTVIYHEYGHFVDELAGGISKIDGLSEGWGDIFSIFLTGQPQVGEGFFSSGKPVRNAENNYKYNQKDEVHQSGQAWMGFAWNLRKLFIAKYGEKGIRMIEELVVPTILANSENIPNAIRTVIDRDDDDGNLSNGTPNLSEIKKAAADHGIDL